MCDNNGKSFIATLYNISSDTEFCNWSFFHYHVNELKTQLTFYKGFCTVFFSANEQKAVTWTHTTQQKHAILVKTKKKSRSEKEIPKRKVSLKWLHQRLGDMFTRSLLAVDTANFWQDIYLRVYSDPFCTSSKISTINKNPISKKPLNTKTPFKWVS